ncbi:MAG: extracellular solute-binding protein [Marmoricola sp.]
MPVSPLGRRTLGTAAALVLLCSLLAACGSSNGAITLTWYTNPDPGGQAAVAKRCSTAHVKIKNQVLPQDAGQQRIQLARRLAAHDSGIDLMSLDPVFGAEFANAGFLAKIPDALQAKLKKQSFKGASAASSWNGQLVVLPFWSNTQVLWYRKDAAAAAGLDMAKPVTWAQLIDAADKLNSRSGSASTKVGVQANKYEGYVVWINALVAGAGGDLVSQTGKGADARVDVDSDAARAAAGVIHKLAGSSAAEPDLSVSNEGTVVPYLFPRVKKGKKLVLVKDAGGFLVNWTFIYSAEKGQVGKSLKAGGIPKSDFANLGWAPYPRTTAAQPSKPPYGGIGIGVSKYSSHPAEAMKAAACIVDPKSQGINADLTGNMPASAAGYRYPALQKTYPADLLRLFQDSVDHAGPRPATPYWSDISGALQSTWHPPSSVGQGTPKKSASFVEDVLKGRSLL